MISKREEVLKMHAQGLSFAEIGRQLGISRERVRQLARPTVATQRRPAEAMVHERMLNTTEIARRCGITVHAVRSWVRTGKLPAFQSDPRCHLRFQPKDVEDFLAKRAKRQNRQNGA
jgi:DNA-binding CsgD family transcriptional regulator